MIVDEERLTVSQTARRVGVAIPTIWRWILGGVKGRKLNAVKIGGRRWILATDLESFLRADTPSEAPAPSTLKRAALAERELERLGI